MRKIIVVLAGVFSFLLVTLLSLPFVVDVNQYKQDILDKIKQQTGYNVVLNQPISISFVPVPTIFLQEIKVETVSELSDQETLFEASALEVQISLAELLFGKVAIQSLALESPVITIHQHQSGRFNFQSEKLFPENKPTEASAQPSTGTAFSIGAFKIKDGSLRFFKSESGQSKKEIVSAEKINSTFRMDSLNGPFEIKGDFVYGGQIYQVDGNTGQIGSAADPLAVNMSLGMPDQNITLDYAGVLSLGESLGAQGEISLRLQSMKTVLSNLLKIDHANLTALVSYDDNAIAMTNASLQLGDQTLSGRGQANLDTMSFQLALGSIGIVDLDKIINPISAGAMAHSNGTRKNAEGKEAQGAAAFLPDLPALPENMAFDLGIKLPGFRYGGELFGETNLSALSGAQNKALNLAFSIETLPGQGDINIQAAYEVAQNKKAPSLGFDIVARSKNLPFSIETFGLDIGDSISAWSEGFVSVSGNISPQSIMVDKAKLSLDGMDIHGQGSLKQGKDGARPVLSFKTTSDVLLLDETLEKISQAQSKKQQVKASAEGGPQALKQQVKKVLEPITSLPMDIHADVGIQRLRFMEQDIRGFRSVMHIEGNTLKEMTISSQNIMGAQASLQGKVGDLKQLSDIDVSLSANAQDLRKFIENLKLDAVLIPEKIIAPTAIAARI